MKPTRINPPLIASLTIGFALGGAQAATIAITNHSFETTAVGAGPPAASNTLVSGWLDLGTAGDNGVFRGNSAGFSDFGQGAAPTDGLNMAFMNDVVSAGLVQTVGTQYQAGLDYELKVDIAARIPTVNLNEGATLYLFTGSITTLAQLTAANIVTSLTVSSANGFANDVFTTFTLTATAAQVAAVGGVGQNIGIAIRGRTSGVSGQNQDIDNVRLDSIPEPTALSLVAGLGGLLLLRRRRSARDA